MNLYNELIGKKLEKWAEMRNTNWFNKGYPDAEREIQMPERRIQMLWKGIRMRSSSRPINDEQRRCWNIFFQFYTTPFERSWEKQVPIYKNQYYAWENRSKLKESRIQINWKRTVLGHYMYIYMYIYSEISILFSLTTQNNMNTDTWTEEHDWRLKKIKTM